MATLRNPHPGIILKEEFIDELGLTQNALAKAIKVPQNRISEIVRGARRITAPTDLCLCRYFGLSEGFWLRLQNSYDLMEAHRRLDKKIQEIIPLRSTAWDSCHPCTARRTAASSKRVRIQTASAKTVWPTEP